MIPQNRNYTFTLASMLVLQIAFELGIRWLHEWNYISATSELVLIGLAIGLLAALWIYALYLIKSLPHSERPFALLFLLLLNSSLLRDGLKTALEYIRPNISMDLYSNLNTAFAAFNVLLSLAIGLTFFWVAYHFYREKRAVLAIIFFTVGLLNTSFIIINKVLRPSAKKDQTEDIRVS